MRNMKTVTLSQCSKYKMLHIEAPGCIINIRIDVCHQGEHPMTMVDVMVDGDRYAGDPEWWVNGERGQKAEGIRVVQVPHDGK